MVEILLAAAILAVIVLPLWRFTTGLLRGFVVLDARQKNEDLNMRTLVILENDFKDMTQVKNCDVDRIYFYMDSRRAPNYIPEGDQDGDGIPNRKDPDDDGDAFDHVRNAQDFMSLPSAISGVGWKQGLDLEDEDDDNDGFPDVICRYQYSSSRKALRRRFYYHYRGNNTTTAWEVIVSSVVAFQFAPSGSPSINDPNTDQAPPIADGNSDGVLDAAELGGFPLNTFGKTRHITSIGYSMTIQPNKNRPEKKTIKSTIKPVLMSVKEKYGIP